MENIYKIGDFVYVIDMDPCCPTPRDVAGKIIGIRQGHWLVEFQGWRGGHDGADLPRGGGAIANRWFLYESQIRPAVDPGQTFIVVGSNGAAPYPFKHPTRGAAEAESGRLAMKMPGVEFVVYHAITKVRAPKPAAEVVFLDKAA